MVRHQQVPRPRVRQRQQPRAPLQSPAGCREAPPQPLASAGAWSGTRAMPFARRSEGERAYLTDSHLAASCFDLVSVAAVLVLSVSVGRRGIQVVFRLERERERGWARAKKRTPLVFLLCGLSRTHLCRALARRGAGQTTTAAVTAAATAATAATAAAVAATAATAAVTAATAATGSGGGAEARAVAATGGGGAVAVAGARAASATGRAPVRSLPSRLPPPSTQKRRAGDG